MGSGGGEENAPTGNGPEIYKFLFEPSDLVPVAWIMSYQQVSHKLRHEAEMLE